MKKTSSPQATGLFCELLSEPAKSEILSPRPKFGWMLSGSTPGAFQTAFRIIVGTSPEFIIWDAADMWDTEKRVDEASLHVPYSGKPLESQTEYFWKVMIWDNRGIASHWSEIQKFKTGDIIPDAQHPSLKLTTTTENPIRLIRKSEDSLFLDFGKVAFGTIEIVKTVDDSKKIKILLGEVSDGTASINENPGGARRFKRLTLELEPEKPLHKLTIPPDERNTTTTLPNSSPGAILMPTDIGEVLPFRYCEIIGDLGFIDKRSVRRVSAHYPFDDAAAEFHSSSPVLNDIWNLCAYSIKATSFLGVYVDGDRERIPYEADAYINQLGHYCVDREFAMARATHEHLLRNPTWPTEWIMFSIMMAWADYEHTGDAGFLRKHYKDLVAKALAPLEREDGLLDTSEDRQTQELLNAIHLRGAQAIKDIVDWPECERDGCDMRRINTVVNAFHAHVLRLLSKIAKVVGEHRDAAKFAKKAARTVRSLTRLLFDNESTLFIDGEGSRHSSAHANFFPLAFGLVPKEKIPRIAEFLKSKGMPCSVYGAQFLLEALYNAEEGEAALTLMTSPGKRGWARWIYELDSTITLEAWSDEVKPNQDWNHAWGAAPCNIIPKRLMGITPLKPGFKKINLRPCPGSLAYASIKVPTIRGPIHLSFENSPGHHFTARFSIPANSSAKFTPPSLGRAVDKVTLDGKTVRVDQSRDLIVLDDIPSGEHTLEVSIAAK